MRDQNWTDLPIMEKALERRPRLLGERAARHDLGGIGRTKLWELIKTKQLDVVRIGRRTLVVSDSVDKLIETARSKSKEIGDVGASRST